VPSGLPLVDLLDDRSLIDREDHCAVVRGRATIELPDLAEPVPGVVEVVITQDPLILRGSMRS
jgi:hypothetical protein